jgi:hypothetical protein
MHLPEREQIRSAMEQAAARREHRLQWLDGSVMGIAAVTVAWGAFLFFWAPYRIIRWLIGAAPCQPESSQCTNFGPRSRQREAK